MSVYREPAEIAEDIPPLPEEPTWQLLLAIVILAPVRLFWWCWPWLAMNALLAFGLMAPLAEYPRETGFVMLGLNVAVAVVYGLVRAHRWAVRVVEAGQHKSEGDSK